MGIRLKVLVLHLVPIHIQGSPFALLHRLHHRASLIGSGILVQNFEQIVARSVHLRMTQDPHTNRLAILFAELIPPRSAERICRAGGRGCSRRRQLSR